MTAPVKDSPTRSFSMALEINATPEEIWRALTDAGELVRWFPLQSRVTPGVGGRMFWGWDGRWAWESQIESWDPGRRLRLIEQRPAFDAAGQPLPNLPHALAMEFTLESLSGSTRLRLVHSGFGHGTDWDDEIESVSNGWQFELRSLRHYLEHHRGRDRHHWTEQFVTALPLEVVWSRLFRDRGFQVLDGGLAADTRCVVALPSGDRLSGIVEWYRAGSELFVIADELDAGGFRISAWRGGGKTGAQVWLTTYSPAVAPLMQAMGQRLRTPLERLLA